MLLPNFQDYFLKSASNDKNSVYLINSKINFQFFQGLNLCLWVKNAQYSNLKNLKIDIPHTFNAVLHNLWKKKIVLFNNQTWFFFSDTAILIICGGEKGKALSSHSLTLMMNSIFTYQNKIMSRRKKCKYIILFPFKFYENRFNIAIYILIEEFSCQYFFLFSSLLTNLWLS